MKKTGLFYKNKSVFPVFLLLLLAVMANAQQIPFKIRLLITLKIK